MSERPLVSVNLRANELVAHLIGDAARFGLGMARGASGETLIDAGSKAAGGIEAGLRIAGICLGGLAEVTLLTSQATPRWPWTIAVRSSMPVIACLASQYAGWRLPMARGKTPFSRSARDRPARWRAREAVLGIGYAIAPTEPC